MTCAVRVYQSFRGFSLDYFSRRSLRRRDKEREINRGNSRQDSVSAIFFFPFDGKKEMGDRESEAFLTPFESFNIGKGKT